MSDKESSKVSADEIIEDLTKDLTQSVVSDKEDKESCISEKLTDLNLNENEPKNSENCQLPEEILGAHSNSDDEDADKEEIEDDYVDEEQLKALEETLSAEDLEERHKKSIELKAQGNAEFSRQEWIESVSTYTEALNLCPLKFKEDRAILYSNRGAAKIKLKRDKSAISDCTRAVELNENYVRAYLRRAKLYEKSDKLDESLEDYQHVLKLDPHNQESLSACVRLPPLINERNEKLKGEMLGKLKDLGNMFLKPFGLSTNNFQMQQDPATGSYSINFQQ